MLALRRWVWTAVAIAAVAVVAFECGRRAAIPPEPPQARVAAAASAMRTALQRYRDDHGFYPCDPERDYNRSASEELLREQLTGFTRDDGKPSERRDAEYCFGPYLAEIPADALTGSRKIAVDVVRARTGRQLWADVAANNGAGGWYYEVRTGFVVANHGRGRAPRAPGR